MEPPASWVGRACTGMDPDIFYPEDGKGLILALRICAECPVKRRCLEWALANGERFGVWGGESERSRRRMRRARRAA